MSKEKKIVGTCTVDEALEQFASLSEKNREIVEKATASKMFMVYLETGEQYLMEIGYNFKDYKIKKENLYHGFHKLGKITAIREIKTDGI